MRSVIHVVSLPLLLAAVGCISPVAHGRTAKMLDDGYLRYGAIVGTGVTPASEDAAAADFSRRAVTLQGDPRTDAGTAVLAVLSSPRLHGAIPVGNQCEGGLLADVVRFGAEFRCGRSAGGVDAALSGAFSAPGYLGGGDDLELRVGLDLSRARGNVVPLLNVYLGYVPPFDDVRLPVANDYAEASRAEYRLSAPVGIAFIGGEAPERNIFVNTTLSVIPELAFADVRYQDTPDPPPNPEPTWAIFVMLRFDVVQRATVFQGG
jgi:hypothetical protein